MQQNLMPKIELSILKGDPLEFQQWIISFEKTIEESTNDPAHRLHYLMQYTAGDANTIVSGFALGQTNDGYLEAKRELKREFGDPVVLACAYMKQIDSWGAIKSGDGGALRAFQNTLARVVAQKPRFCHITPVLSDLHWLSVRHRISFKIATVTYRVLQFQQPSYLASLIPRYVPARALRSSSSLSICVPTRKTTTAASKSFSSVASGIWNALPSHLSSVPTLPVFRRALKHIIYSCLLTLTVVPNLVWSNQLNVSHFVIQRQLLPSHSPQIPCRPSKRVPSERLRLVKRFISHRLHTGAWGNLVLLTYLLLS